MHLGNADNPDRPVGRGRSGSPSSGVRKDEGPFPTQGTVWMGQDQYAWQIKAGGLQLVPAQGLVSGNKECQGADRSESMSFKGVDDYQRASAANVFQERAVTLSAASICPIGVWRHG